LAAHAVLYGGEHAMGGVYHALLTQAALVAGLGLLVLFAALSWSLRGSTVDGTVLASRLRDRLPGLRWVFAATTLWYAGAEAVEPHHESVSIAVAAIVLAAAAWLILRLSQGVAGAFARVAIAVVRTAFSRRAPSWHRRPHPRPFLRRVYLARRRYARPPPIAAPTRA
jgi:MFS family permease